VPVKPEKVRPFLAADQELKESLERAADNQAKISLIENLLMDCKDAVSAVKDELKNDPVRYIILCCPNITNLYI
jgi:signal recognition particle subunit SRP68